MPPTNGLLPAFDISKAAAPKTSDAITTTTLGAYQQRNWSGGFNVASVDLIAMVVSDAGLANTEPQWWNASPTGCMLLGMQPRGGWQVLQRAVQWGTDHWAHCFGVSCKVPILYAYFACTIRNRIEVWDSENFISPMEDQTELKLGEAKTVVEDAQEQVETRDKALKSGDDNLQDVKVNHEVTEKGAEFSPLSSPAIQPKESGDEIERIQSTPQQKKQAKKSEKYDDTSWNRIDRGLAGIFNVRRPTKLIDGSRGGQSFMCNLLRPEAGKAYGVEEQARLQLLSVILVMAGLTKSNEYTDFLRVAQDDFGLSSHLGVIFKRLVVGLLLSNFVVLGFAVSLCYALWHRNIYGNAIPYLIQICSLVAWASGAIGLLMLGGNPRVSIDHTKPAPKHIQGRLGAIEGDFATLEFGSLHGSVYVHDQGSCPVATEVVRAVCRWRINLTRSWSWYFGMAWFASFLFLSIALQIAASKVSTIKSEVMAIILLILTSVVRGAGLSGPESWMIPWWCRRAGTRHAVKLIGHIASRASVSET